MEITNGINNHVNALKISFIGDMIDRNESGIIFLSVLIKYKIGGLEYV
jgi:hypothetical protein